MCNFKCIAVSIKIWYQILIVVSVVVSILSLVVWLAMIIYISINGEYDMSIHVQCFVFTVSSGSFSQDVYTCTYTCDTISTVYIYTIWSYIATYLYTLYVLHIMLFSIVCLCVYLVHVV